MGKVKEMMKTMGASIPNGAQQLMNQIEQHQQQVEVISISRPKFL